MIKNYRLRHALMELLPKWHKNNIFYRYLIRASLAKPFLVASKWEWALISQDDETFIDFVDALLSIIWASRNVFSRHCVYRWGLSADFRCWGDVSSRIAVGQALSCVTGLKTLLYCLRWLLCWNYRVNMSSQKHPRVEVTATVKPRTWAKRHKRR